jgi:hypothetical protein
MRTCQLTGTKPIKGQKPGERDLPARNYGNHHCLIAEFRSRETYTMNVAYLISFTPGFSQVASNLKIKGETV